MNDSLEWLLIAFFASLLLAYWNQGVVAYLFYLLLTELFIFLAFHVPPKKRVKVVFVSLIGYALGTLLFYSHLPFSPPKKRNKLGELIASNLDHVQNSLLQRIGFS